MRRAIAASGPAEWPTKHTLPVAPRRESRQDPLEAAQSDIEIVRQNPVLAGANLRNAEDACGSAVTAWLTAIRFIRQPS